MRQSAWIATPSASKVTDDHELLPEDLEQLVSDYKTAVHLELGVPFPEDPEEQLWGAIGFLPRGRMWGPQMAGVFSGPTFLKSPDQNSPVRG